MRQKVGFWMFADRRLLHIYGQWNCVCGGVGQCGSDIGGGGAGGAARAGVGDSLLRHDGRARDGHLPNHAVVRTARTSAQHTLAAPHWGHTAPPQIVARPPNLVVSLTHCGQLILRKIRTFHATRCQILRIKCTKFDFRWGTTPDPAWGGGLQRSPKPLNRV